MKIDVIILSNTHDLKYYGLLQRTINTLVWSEPNFDFNIIVVESNKKYLEKGFVCYNCNKIITPKEEFNYNRFLNFGLKETLSDWVIIANNDLIFSKNWLTKIFEFQKNNNEYKSFSPFEPNWHCHKSLENKEFYNGYRTAYEITGWCLLINREVIEKCNLFDEKFAFWYQDNDYAMTLQKHQIKHALIRNSRVYHETSQSHDLLGIKKNDLTHNQKEIFEKKWFA